MAKRISLKGKGADIFFGEYPQLKPDTDSAEGTPVAEVSPPSEAITKAEPESTKEVKKPSQQEPKQARLHASKNARMQASMTTDIKPGPVLTSPLAEDILGSIWQNISERATITNAFRYTNDELSRLTDAIYEITKQHGVKLSKQDIARLGLDAILWDYNVRGDDSLLIKMALRRKKQSKGEA